jgi:uncharacterized lipoprotein YbaY
VADCDDRQLTDAQRAAGARAQRTGVAQAVRPFRGAVPPELRGLIDWLNRELLPVVSKTRDAVNEVYRPVLDNVPGTGNPLAHYFSSSTAAADPGSGRLALNQATQNTATTLRISNENAQLADISVFVEVMEGSVTEPLGILTLSHARDPSRFIRFDLTAITDQNTFWELTVDPVESSHDSPFVDGDPVTVAFLPGVGSDGATVPYSSTEGVAPGTIMSNVTDTVASPSPNSVDGFAGAGLVWNDTDKSFDVGQGAGITVNANDVEWTGLVSRFDGGSDLTARRRLHFVSNVGVGLIAVDSSGNAETQVGAYIPIGTHGDIEVSGTGGSVWTLRNGVVDVANWGTIGAHTVIANPTGSAATPQEYSLNTLFGDGIQYNTTTGIANIVAGDNIQVTANGVGWTGVNVRENSGGSVLTRRRLNLIEGANVSITLGDDSGNDEVDITIAATDTNTTYSAGDGIDLSGTTFLADVSDFAGSGLEDDGSNNLRISAAAAGNGLTGGGGSALAVGAGTGITVSADAVSWSGVQVRENSGGTTLTRRRINLIEGSNITLTLGDDSGNDEVDVTIAAAGSTFNPTDHDSTSIVVSSNTFQRAALTGEVTASQNSNTTTITRSTNFDSSPWTGPHAFESTVTIEGAGGTFLCNAFASFGHRIDWDSVQSESIPGGSTIDPVTLNSSTNVLRLNPSTEAVNLDGISGGSAGRLLIVCNVGSVNIVVRSNQGATASTGILTGGGSNVTLTVNACMLLWYDGSSSRWRIIGLGL